MYKVIFVFCILQSTIFANSMVKSDSLFNCSFIRTYSKDSNYIFDWYKSTPYSFAFGGLQKTNSKRKLAVVKPYIPAFNDWFVSDSGVLIGFPVNITGVPFGFFEESFNEDDSISKYRYLLNDTTIENKWIAKLKEYISKSQLWSNSQLSLSIYDTLGVIYKSSFHDMFNGVYEDFYGVGVIRNNIIRNDTLFLTCEYNSKEHIYVIPINSFREIRNRKKYFNRNDTLFALPMIPDSSAYVPKGNIHKFNYSQMLVGLIIGILIGLFLRIKGV